MHQVLSLFSFNHLLFYLPTIFPTLFFSILFPTHLPKRIILSFCKKNSQTLSSPDFPFFFFSPTTRYDQSLATFVAGYNAASHAEYQVRKTKNKKQKTKNKKQKAKSKKQKAKSKKQKTKHQLHIPFYCFSF